MAMFLICIHAIEFNEVVMWKYENEPLKANAQCCGYWLKSAFLIQNCIGRNLTH